MSLQKRSLDRLLRALGHDQQLAETPILDTSRIVLVSMLDDLSHAHGANAFARLLVSMLPTTGAATFSSFEFTPHDGLWIREMAFSGGNARMEMRNGGGPTGAYTVADVLTTVPVICGRPEDCDFPAFFQSSLAVLVAGSATVPKILRDAQVGQAASNPQVGVFITPTQPGVVRDLWIPDGVTFSLSCTAPNVAITAHLQLDLPAENFFT